MVTAFVGDTPDMWPVKTEQHETYQQVNQYVIGRYLITLPEGFKKNGIDTSFGRSSRQTVREVDWPDASSTEEQRELLWQAHLEKIEKYQKNNITPVTQPYYKVEKSTINTFPVKMTFFYDHKDNTFMIYNQEGRTAVKIYSLVDYNSHAVWFYDYGYADEQAEVQARLTTLIEQYEPYANSGKATIKPNAYHMLRGVMNRPLTNDEKMETSFGISSERDHFSLGVSTSIASTIAKSTRHEALPSIAADFNIKVKKLRKKTREAMDCKGYESVITMKAPNNFSIHFDWWCNDTNDEVNYPLFELSAITDTTSDALKLHLARWDFIVDNLQKIKP